jgi:hypothetical protein
MPVMAVLVLHLIAFFAAAAPSANAQNVSSVLTGVVANSKGEAVGRASIQIRHDKMKGIVLETAGDEKGRFDFVGLLGGRYYIEVTTTSSSCAFSSPIEINSGQTREIRIMLASETSTTLLCSQIVQIENEATWRTPFREPSGRPVPDTRTLWSILENQAPSLVTDSLDIGGLQTGQQALFGALGSSWTENVYLMNGLNITDPYVPGRALMSPDFDTISEFQVITAFKSPSRPGSGVILDLATVIPTEQLHGSAQTFFSTRNLQSDNVGTRIERFGFPGPERVRHFVDTNVQLNTKWPIETITWPFLISFGTRHLSKTLGGFDGPISAHIYNGLARFVPISRDRHALNVLYAIQRVSNDRQGAAPGVAAESTTRQTDTFHQLQGHWSINFNRPAVLTTSFGVVKADLSTDPQPGALGASTLDLPLMSLRGPAALLLSGERTVWEATSVYQSVQHGFAGSHSLAISAGINRNPISNRWASPDGFSLTFVNGVGSQITRWETPARARQTTTGVAFSIHDSWRPISRLSIPVGLRIETVSGSGNDSDNHIRWTSVEPGAGLVTSFIEDRLTLRASWSRSGHILQGKYFDFGNPASVNGETLGWDDANGDRQLQPREITRRLSIFGGAHSAIDNDLDRPYTDEITAGFDGSLGWIKTGARFFRRDTHRQIGLDNIGVPLSSYDVEPFLDPGNDGIPGNSDDRILSLFNRRLSAPGNDFLLLTNLPFGRGSSKGFELFLQQAFGRANYTASFTAIESRAPTNTGNGVFENDPGVIGNLAIDPNTLILTNSRTFFDRAYIGKLIGTYDGPRGFWFGTVIKYYDGLPFGRLLFVDGFNQGPFFVRATHRAQPGGFRTEFNLTMDLRVAREMQLRRGKMSAYVDVFNLLNMDLKTLEASLTGPTFESRVPLAIQAPRLLRLGLLWRF